MRLTKSTSHAIRILIDCARAGDRLIKVAELSQHLQITQQNVFKIVNLLARAGLIEAMRGRNGGVRLARPAAAIRIGDVVRATEVTHVEIEDGTVGRKRSAAAASTRSSTTRSAPSSTCSTSTRWPTWPRASPPSPQRHGASRQVRRGPQRLPVRAFAALFTTTVDRLSDPRGPCFFLTNSKVPTCALTGAAGSEKC